MTASISIAVFGQDGATGAVVPEAGGDALHTAKAGGRDRYRPAPGAAAGEASAEVTPGAPKAPQPPRQTRGG